MLRYLNKSVKEFYNSVNKVSTAVNPFSLRSAPQLSHHNRTHIGLFHAESHIFSLRETNRSTAGRSTSFMTIQGSRSLYYYRSSLLSLSIYTRTCTQTTSNHPFKINKTPLHRYVLIANALTTQLHFIVKKYFFSPGRKNRSISIRTMRHERERARRRKISRYITRAPNQFSSAFRVKRADFMRIIVSAQRAYLLCLRINSLCVRARSRSRSFWSPINGPREYTHMYVCGALFQEKRI